jgi:hypothetical protein
MREIGKRGYERGMTTPANDSSDSPPPEDPHGDPVEKAREAQEREQRELDDPETGEPEGGAEAAVQPRS